MVFSYRVDDQAPKAVVDSIRDEVVPIEQGIANFRSRETVSYGAFREYDRRNSAYPVLRRLKPSSRSRFEFVGGVAVPGTAAGWVVNKEVALALSDLWNMLDLLRATSAGMTSMNSEQPAQVSG